MISTIITLRDEGRPLPGAALANSPWLDLSHSGASHETNRASDPMVLHESIHHFARLYAGRHSLQTPTISPVFANLGGLPPMRLNASRTEMFRDDVFRFKERADEAGTSVEISVEHETVHGYAAIPFLPEAKQEFVNASAFLMRHLG